MAEFLSFHRGWPSRGHTAHHVTCIQFRAMSASPDPADRRFRLRFGGCTTSISWRRELRHRVIVDDKLLAARNVGHVPTRVSCSVNDLMAANYLATQRRDGCIPLRDCSRWRTGRFPDCEPSSYPDPATLRTYTSCASSAASECLRTRRYRNAGKHRHASLVVAVATGPRSQRCARMVSLLCVRAASSSVRLSRSALDCLTSARNCAGSSAGLK
jgi:hypothetical protein